MPTMNPTPPAGEPDLRQILASHPLLRDLSPALLDKLNACAMKAAFAAGETIFREGDPANRFYLVLSGQVALSSSNADGREAVVQTIGPGDVLGWSWLFPPYYWNFDARTTAPVEAVFFYGTRLREECETNHDLGYELLKRMSTVVIHRLQAARRQLLAASRA
jgi:CRP/FNR family transcriptional regulator, cyclic AMP receptor protein